MDMTPIERYREIKEYVDAYCDEHDLSEEDRQEAEHFILEPARKEVAKILVSNILNHYWDNLKNLLQATNSKMVKHSVHHVKVHGKAVVTNE